MSIVVPPVAVGVVGIVLIVVAVFVLAALAYGAITRGNPRQVKVDAERERVAEDVPLREHTDFESELKPPREP
jgi:ABC-type transporter Mla subunit MlaD